MNQNSNDAKRQAILAKQKRQQEEDSILSGIIDEESKTYSFEKEIHVNGQLMKGTFVAKYMGVAARLRIGTLRAKLLDGAPSQSVDTVTDDIAYMIAYLTVALVKVPSWWNYDELDEIKELREMYQEVYEFVQSFRGRNGSNSNAGDSSAASSQENVETE